VRCRRTAGKSPSGPVWGRVLRGPPWEEVPMGPRRALAKVTGCRGGHEKPGLFTRFQLPWKGSSPEVQPAPGYDSPAGAPKE